jgi:hypothetical protein
MKTLQLINPVTIGDKQHPAGAIVQGVKNPLAVQLVKAGDATFHKVKANVISVPAAAPAKASKPKVKPTVDPAPEA